MSRSRARSARRRTESASAASRPSGAPGIAEMMDSLPYPRLAMCRDCQAPLCPQCEGHLMLIAGMDCECPVGHGRAVYIQFDPVRVIGFYRWYDASLGGAGMVPDEEKYGRLDSDLEKEDYSE